MAGSSPAYPLAASHRRSTSCMGGCPNSLSLQRLDRAILREGPSDARRQLLSMGVRPEAASFRLPPCHLRPYGPPPRPFAAHSGC
jgi:hypothetical protein